MQIDSSFAEADIGSIRVGQTVRFTVDAFPNRNFKGVVKQIRLNPTTQQNVVTYNVVVSVDNPEQILLPGMTAYVSIVVAQRKDVLLVPNAALRFKPAERKPPMPAMNAMSRQKMTAAVRRSTGRGASRNATRCPARSMCWRQGQAQAGQHQRSASPTTAIPR